MTLTDWLAVALLVALTAYGALSEHRAKHRIQAHPRTDLPERTAMSAEPPARAVEMGHQLQDDPPHALSRVERWTCSGCHATALRNGTYEYGSALDERCTAVAT